MFKLKVLLSNLAEVMHFIMQLFRQEYNFGGYVFSMWQVLLLSLFISVIGYAIGRLIATKYGL